MTILGIFSLSFRSSHMSSNPLINQLKAIGTETDRQSSFRVVWALWYWCKFNWSNILELGDLTGRFSGKVPGGGGGGESIINHQVWSNSRSDSILIKFITSFTYLVCVSKICYLQSVMIDIIGKHAFQSPRSHKNLF